jgi:hypothetical protein
MSTRLIALTGRNLQAEDTRFKLHLTILLSSIRVKGLVLRARARI